MRRGVEGLGVAPAAHDVAARAHRAGYQAELPFARLDCALARYENVLAEVVLALGEVVVALDALDDLEIAAAVLHQPQDALHHLLAVQQRELLRPFKVGDVLVEFGRAFTKVCEVGVRQFDAVALHQRLGDLDVVCGEAVADTARAGVQERPDAVLFVEHNLDEVVAGAERAELLAPVAARLVVELQATQLFRSGFETLNARLRGLLHAGVVAACAEGYLMLDSLADVGQVFGQVGAAHAGLRGDHAAADVHADGRRDDRSQRGDAGAHRRAHAEVAVGHDRDMPEDERHARQVVNLLQRRFFDLLLRHP